MDSTPPRKGGSAQGADSPAPGRGPLDSSAPRNCAPAPHTRLDALGSMEVAIVVEVEADEVDAARLKALGICQGRRIQLVKTGDPLIVRVLGTRVGVSARLAHGITVEPCLSC